MNWLNRASVPDAGGAFRAKAGCQSSELPEPVALVTGGNTPFYASLDDAMAGATPVRTIVGEGGRYVSVTESVQAGGRTFVRTKRGGMG